MRNQLNRELPDFVEGYGSLKPFQGAFSSTENVKKREVYIKPNLAGQSKLREDLKELIQELGLKDGMTLSFHHHLRNGDYVLNLVVNSIGQMGYKNLTIAASSIFPVHEPLVKWIEAGTVTGICANYISGPVAQAISEGKLKKPAIMHTHGGRARAIESGDLEIDIAFIAAPSSDKEGNINGVAGPAACGSLGYAIPDAHYGRQVVAVTDNLVAYPANQIEISQEYVNYVLQVDAIGDPKGIVSGTTQITRDPIGLKIASEVVKLIEASGYLKEGMSFQTGAGGTSLAVAYYLKKKMLNKGITGSFASGGITAYLVDMFEQGLFKTLLDVQCFDLEAVRSFRDNIGHQTISASKYGNPHNKGAVVNHLDVMILGATEIDTDFNVNVTTGSDGQIMGGSGGHSDTAAGAKLAIVATQLIKGRMPIVKDKVTTVTTPGETIDVVVTERGIAVNPKHEALSQQLKKAGLNVMTIDALKDLAYSISGQPENHVDDGPIVALVEYRDGTVIDVVRKV